MKYEHREHFALIAVTDTKFEKPRFLINLNPSVFTPNELMSNGIIIRNELKKLVAVATANDLPLKPGLNIARLDLRDGKVRYDGFNMNMDVKIFREYRQEIQSKIESFFGMDEAPEPLHLDIGQLTSKQAQTYAEASIGYMEASRAYVKQ